MHEHGEEGVRVCVCVDAAPQAVRVVIINCVQQVYPGWHDSVSQLLQWRLVHKHHAGFSYRGDRHQLAGVLMSPQQNDYVANYDAC